MRPRPNLFYPTQCVCVCAQCITSGQKLPPGLLDEVKAGVKLIEADMGQAFGSSDNPLLFSVRSGAAVSVPHLGLVAHTSAAH